MTDALIENKNLANFYQASSSEMFESSNRTKLNEQSEFNPKSPYAKHKFRNHQKVLELRRQFDWNIYSGIMFNHESEFRKENYLFKKVINSALKIKDKQLEKLEVGSLDYVRDWVLLVILVKQFIKFQITVKVIHMLLGLELKTVYAI